MRSRTSARFRKAYAELPEPVRRAAREAYKLFQRDPRHPSLHFKQVHPARPVYSVRINIDYRAVGLVEGDEIIWFWIGSHAYYDRLLTKL